MTLDRFVLWFDLFCCLVTIAIIGYFVRTRKDALNMMRWGRIAVFGGLATIYALGAFDVLDARLNVIVARFYIVPVCVVLGILPSAFRAHDVNSHRRPVDDMTRVEEALQKKLDA